MKKKNEEGEERDEVRFNSGSTSRGRAAVEEEEIEQEEDEEELDAGKVRPVFKYACARRLQIYARRQIFQNHSLRFLLSLLPQTTSWRDRKEDDSLSRESTIITRAGRVPREG